MKGWALPSLGVWIWAHWARQWAHWAYQALSHNLPSSASVIIIFFILFSKLFPIPLTQKHIIFSFWFSRKPNRGLKNESHRGESLIGFIFFGWFHIRKFLFFLFFSDGLFSVTCKATVRQRDESLRE